MRTTGTVLVLAALLAACATGTDPFPGDDTDPPDADPIPQGSWTSVAPLPMELFGVGAVAHAGLIYVVGGMVENDNLLSATSTVFRYDPAVDRWERLADLPAPRFGAPLVVLDDVLYLIGGRSQEEAELPVAEDEVFALDPATGTWSTPTRLPVPIEEHSAAPARDRIMVFGGRIGNGLVQPTLFYDPVANEWTEGRALPRGRLNPGAAATSDTVWVIGGEDIFVAPSDRVDAYEIETQRWILFPAFNDVRANFATAALNERIHIFGGNAGQTLRSHEMLDPAVPENGWRELAPLPSPRSEFQAVALDGAIYVIGGRENNDELARVDVFRP